MIIKKPIKK